MNRDSVAKIVDSFLKSPFSFLAIIVATILVVMVGWSLMKGADEQVASSVPISSNDPKEFSLESGSGEILLGDSSAKGMLQDQKLKDLENFKKQAKKNIAQLEITLKKLKDMADRDREGALSGKIAIKKSPEVEALRKSIDIMMNQIKGAQEEILVLKSKKSTSKKESGSGDDRASSLLNPITKGDAPKILGDSIDGGKKVDASIDDKAIESPKPNEAPLFPDFGSPEIAGGEEYYKESVFGREKISKIEADKAIESGEKVFLKSDGKYKQVSNTAPIEAQGDVKLYAAIDGKISVVAPRKAAELKSQGVELIQVKDGKLWGVSNSTIANLKKGSSKFFTIKDGKVVGITKSEAKEVVGSGEVVSYIEGGEIINVGSAADFKKATSKRIKLKSGISNGYLKEVNTNIYIKGADGTMVEIADKQAAQAIKNKQDVFAINKDTGEIKIIKDIQGLDQLVKSSSDLGVAYYNSGLFDGMLTATAAKKFKKKDAAVDKLKKAKEKVVVKTPAIPAGSEVYAEIDSEIIGPILAPNADGTASIIEAMPVKLIFKGDIIHHKKTGRISLDNCYSLAQATGEIYSVGGIVGEYDARIKIIPTTITCINRNNEIVEFNIGEGEGGFAWVIDTYDNTPGVRGQYVDNMNSYLKSSLVANVAAGIGDAFDKSGTQATTTTAAGTGANIIASSIPSGQEFQRGIGKGVNTTVSDYIKIKAEELKSQGVRRIVVAPKGAIVKVVFSKTIKLPKLLD